MYFYDLNGCRSSTDWINLTKQVHISLPMNTPVKGSV